MDDGSAPKKDGGKPGKKSKAKSKKQEKKENLEDLKKELEIVRKYIFKFGILCKWDVMLKWFCLYLVGLAYYHTGRSL